MPSFHASHSEAEARDGTQLHFEQANLWKAGFHLALRACKANTAFGWNDGYLRIQAVRNTILALI